jgi:hypothetical protein
MDMNPLLRLHGGPSALRNFGTSELVFILPEDHVPISANQSVRRIESTISEINP